MRNPYTPVFGISIQEARIVASFRLVAQIQRIIP
jgi:hypothetical protein